MCTATALCDNVRFGFNCMIDWEKSHPGNKSYGCEFCGIYDASAPHCNKCEQFERGDQSATGDPRE